jgi:hypothetical protein
LAKFVLGREVKVTISSDLTSIAQAILQGIKRLLKRHHDFIKTLQPAPNGSRIFPLKSGDPL